MRHLLVIPALLLLAACSGSSETLPENASPQDAADHTDKCLDNPELAKSWGDCNVKHTVFGEHAALAKCRKANPKAKGTVNFQLQIRGDGSVKSVKPLGGSGKHTACVTKVMKGLKFAPPPSGKEPVITVPYQLEP